MNKPDQNSKPAFSGERIALGEYVTAAKRRNTNAKCTAVYSVTNSYGFTPSEAYFSKEVYSKELKTYKVVERNMIAFNPSRINVGSVALQDKADEVIVSPLYVVFSVDERRLLPEYVVRFLKSKPGLRQIAARSIGTVRNNLKYDALCRMEMNLPSLEDQQTQLAALSLVEKQISAQKAMISHLQSLAKSRFVEMFGKELWQKKSIGDLALDIRYGTSKKASNAGKYTYLRMNNITDDGRLDFSDTKKIDLEDDELEKCTARKGDLLFNRTNSREKVGKTAVFMENDPMVIAGYIIRVRLGDEVRSQYLATFMNLPTTKSLLRSISKGAVHQANINSKELASIEVPVPPKEIQDTFAAFAGRAAKLEFVAQQQIEKLQTLYDSLAQEYFG